MYAFTFCVWFLGYFIMITDSRSLHSVARKADRRNGKVFKMFEMQFLNMLGLKEKPRVKRDAVTPQHMLDLYNDLVEDDKYVSTNLAFKDFSTTANTVRSFYHEDVQDAAADGRSHNYKKRLAVDISLIPFHEELVKAELRVYRNTLRNLTHPKHIINVYEILQPGVGEKSVKRLLESRVVDVPTMSAWESYDISQAVQRWRDNANANHGLEVDIMSENGNPMDMSHLSFSKPEEMEERIWPHHRPLVTVYTWDPKTHYHKEREVPRSMRQRRSTKRNNLCKRHDLRVNFRKDLGWDWVMLPPAYNAYYCKGDCVYPLTEHMNATNHAIVQTLVHESKKYRNSVPPACCIPTSLDVLPIVYTDVRYVGGKKHEMIVLKRYGEMTVTGCGCR